MPQLSMMIKPASSACNLDCRYCFYKDVAKHRSDFNFGTMTDDTASILIKKSLEYADGESIFFTFQGGEPTLAGIDFFKAFAENTKKLNSKGSEIFYAIQTNGTNIDDKWASFFAENNFLVGLSLDGDFDGNKFRKYSTGESSFSNVIKAAKCLKRHNAQFNIVSVLTGANAENGTDIYTFFRSKGFRYLQFVPCLRPFGSKEKSELYMTSEQYADFLIKTFRLYADDFVKGRYTSIRLFDNWVRLYLNQPAEQCGLSGHCSRQFVAESNGNIYPCDFYCTDEYMLGSIRNKSLGEMAESNTAKNFISESLSISEKCRECRYYPICRGGGCKREKLSENYCEAYKKFFSECLPLFSAFRNRNTY